MIELERTSGDRLLVNPTLVSAVLTASDGDTIVRLADGRGFRIVGTYAEVCTRLGFEIAESTVTTEVAVEAAESGDGADAPAVPGDIARGEDV